MLITASPLRLSYRWFGAIFLLGMFWQTAHTATWVTGFGNSGTTNMNVLKTDSAGNVHVGLTFSGATLTVGGTILSRLDG